MRKLWELGFRASVGEVVTAGAAVQYLLAGRGGGTAFVIGAEALIDHVADAGLRVVNNTELASRADVVVVASHDDLRYAELRAATQSVGRGAELIGTTREPSFPEADGPWPGSGAILAAVEVASGRTADRIAGKPEAPMYEAALDRLGHPKRVLGIGDRLTTDVAGAIAAGLDGAVVLTGVTSRADLDGDVPEAEHRRGELRGAGPRPRIGSCAHAARRLRHRQPARRRGPRRRAAARGRGRPAPPRPALPRRAHDVDGARARAGPRRARRRRDRRGDGRRRPHRRRRRRAARHRRRARGPARRPRQRLRAQARDPGRAVGGGRRARRRRRAARRRRRRGRAHLPGHRVRRAGLRHPGDRELDAPEARQPRLPLRPAARARQVAGRALDGDDRRRAARVHRLLGRRLQLRRVRRRHVPGAGREPRRRAARRRPDRRSPRSASTWPACRRCSRARTSRTRR